MSTIATPNPTLYVSNIDWKIKKPLLRRALYSLFTRHGKVLEIITLRREGLRGQAWVIFDSVQSATAALQAEQGFTFFGKDLKLAYANEKSDRIAKRDGTYVPRAKRTTKKIQQQQQQQAHAQSTVTQQPAVDVDSSSETSAAAIGKTPSATAIGKVPSATSTPEPPSHILFAKNLPTECNEMMLSMLFRQYGGFKEVRIPRPGLSFIEFETEPQATVALKQLNGFQLTVKDKLQLSYGKK